jgi:hypothetical protein
LFVENEGLPKMSKNMNKHATKYKSAVVLSTSEKIAYMYTFKIMFDTSVIQ